MYINAWLGTAAMVILTSLCLAFPTYVKKLKLSYGEDSDYDIEWSIFTAFFALFQQGIVLLSKRHKNRHYDNMFILHYRCSQ